jgi:hypothetical protein
MRLRESMRVIDRVAATGMARLRWEGEANPAAGLLYRIVKI